MSNDTFLIDMGQKIRIARKAKGMSLDTMAGLTKIARDNLSIVERGKRNCHVLSLKSIAEVLEMDVKDFL
jgi:transcriptional regulator with XRE-family HTH domain